MVIEYEIIEYCSKKLPNATSFGMVEDEKNEKNIATVKH
jgi:hypothetical protein